MVSLVEVYSSLSQKQRKPIHEDTEYWCYGPCKGFSWIHYQSGC
jgi:hypothetical protein